MTIKEKLEIMAATANKNRAADQAFVETEKNLKEWLVSFAVVTSDNHVVDDEFIGKAADMLEMVTLAKALLDEVAPSMGWVKWMIWDVGIMDGQLMF